MDVARNQWAGFFDRISVDHLGDQVEIEVLDGEFGDQIEIQRMPFESAAYDPREDTVVVTVGDPVTLRHMVEHPTEIDVDTTAPMETVVRVASVDSTTLVHFYPTPAITG
jgi:Family of unknown function (DUF5335)